MNLFKTLSLGFFGILMISHVASIPVHATTITNNPDILLNLKAGDDTSGVALKQFRLIPHDWKGWTPYDPQDTLTPTNILTDGGIEGWNDYVAIVKDLAGNESTTMTRRVLLDMTGPTIKNLKVSPQWTNKEKITVTATALDNFEPDTAVKTISLSNDQTNFKVFDVQKGALKTEFTIPLIDGIRTLYAQATDTAGTGNKGPLVSTTYMVDTVNPIGGIVIEQGGDYIPSSSTSVTFNVEDLKTVENNRSGISTVRLFDVHGSGDYTFDFDADASLQEQKDITVPWELATTIDPEGMETGQVGIEITDRAGNSIIEYSQEVIVSKIVATQLCITNVVNPKDFPASNPFKPVCYNNLTGVGFAPIPMLMGGSFTFEIDYTYPAITSPTWNVSLSGQIEYDDDQRTVTRYITETNLPVTGKITYQEITPYPNDVPSLSVAYGMDVYFDSTLEIYDSLGRKVGFDFLPRPEGTSLKIGYIEGDIREYLQFNEIN